jgi:hypothetical protein
MINRGEERQLRWEADKTKRPSKLGRLSTKSAQGLD